MTKINVKQNLVPASRYGLKAPNAMTAEYITVHNTANDATAANEIAYMLRNNASTSYHFAVDEKEVVQGVPVNRNAWHCGDGRGNGNMKSIGVEICYSKSGGQKYAEAEELSVQFVAQLLHERGWNVDRVKKHEDWSGKYCPHRILAEGRWQSYLGRVTAALSALKGGEKTAPAAKPQTGGTQVGAKPAPKPTPKPSGNLGLVDWMNANKMDASFSNRAKLAGQYGITGYKGTAAQNTELLAKLQGGNAAKPNPAPTPKKPKYALPTGVLRRGAKGNAVRQLQTALNAANFRVGTVDGDYGPKTQDAVRRFQSVHLPREVDGVYGPNTRKALDKAVN